MKKTITTIAALGFVSTMFATSAFAGGRHLEVMNPFWVPVAILSTVAATVATIVQPPVLFERRGYYEPHQTVIYEEPRQYRRDAYYERGPAHYYYDRDRANEGPRYRDYR
jgi:hypothetical protein